MAEEIIREPVVAGMFYPGSITSLTKQINQFLNEAPDFDIKPKKVYGIISPHAGYIYSGIVAAAGYKFLKNNPAKDIIIIAPSHKEYFLGASIFPGDYYQTPLGLVKVNKEIGTFLAENHKYIDLSYSGHREEHSLEVQLPFLQVIFNNDFNIVPIVIGEHDLNVINELSTALQEASKNHNFIVIASSDLSHYHSYDIAVKIDRLLINKLEKYNLEELEEDFIRNNLEACGIAPILTLLKYAKLSGSPVFKTLDYKNSGDTSGTKSQVVGYLSAVIYEP